MTLLATTLILTAACVSRADKDSRTADVGASTAQRRAWAPQVNGLHQRGRAAVREHCPQSVKAITYYRRAYTRSRSRMNLSGAVPRVWYQHCASLRERATAWREKAKGARTELAAWQREWAAPPEPFLSIARCENRGSGPYGVNWDAYNSVYEGAYGFLHSTWDGYKPAGYPDSASSATIRQQTEVARILVATFGGYSSWPACHIRLGLPG